MRVHLVARMNAIYHALYAWDFLQNGKEEFLLSWIFYMAKHRYGAVDDVEVKVPNSLDGCVLLERSVQALS